MVSSKSGHLFEKRLVIKAIEVRLSDHMTTMNIKASNTTLQDTGKCPITGELLAEADLLTVKGNKVRNMMTRSHHTSPYISQAVKPRSTPAASIPGLLGLFQNVRLVIYTTHIAHPSHHMSHFCSIVQTQCVISLSQQEWDAVMLEAHNLRQSLHTVRQELSHALYQHDAAQRVIARLIKERDEARAALANVAAHGGHDLANGKRTQDEEMEDAPAKRVRGPCRTGFDSMLGFFPYSQTTPLMCTRPHANSQPTFPNKHPRPHTATRGHHTRRGRGAHSHLQRALQDAQRQETGAPRPCHT